MRYTDQKDFVYEPEVFSCQDAQMNLRVHNEFTVRHSAKPFPKFFEVDREGAEIDPVFHAPKGGRVKFTRELELPCIVTFEKPGWTMTRIGYQPLQKYKMWLSNLTLKQQNYFPTRGDLVAYRGYRLFITRCAPDPDSYWQQTGVWMGIVAECQVFPEGDSRPVDNTAQLVPAERSPNSPGKPYPAAPNALPFPLI